MLVAAGDVLPHRRVKEAGARHGWSTVFADIAPLIRGADLAMANLESPVAPDAHQGIHGEVFNAPQGLLGGLVQAGFDVVSLANNHAFDQGPDGLVETWRRARATGLGTIGAGPSCAAAAEPHLAEVDGVKIAFIATVDLVNIDGNTTDDAPCLFVAGDVCTGDCGPDRDAVHFRPELARLTSAITAAREGADLVIVSAHWGDEYRTEPLPEYPPLAAALVNAGADAIIGHHPHVLQPVQRLVASDGREAVVAFSLGNLVSDMAQRYDVAHSPPRRGNTRDGALLAIQWTVSGDAPPRLTEVGVIPTWTDNQPDRITVIRHETLSSRSPSLYEVRRTEVSKIIESSLMMEVLPSSP